MTKEKLKQTKNLDEVKEIALNLFDENKILQEQVKNLQDKLFGRKSEKTYKDDGQLSLFDIPDLPMSKEPEQVTIPEHTRKKRGRRPLPENLERIEVVHDLTEEEKQCKCGCQKSRIGQEESEQLDYIPAKVQVIKHIRYKYACKNCEGVEDDSPTVSIAGMPEQIIPKSIATPGLLAHILTAKFADALPFYRQEKQFLRMGIELPRATMCNWGMKVAISCEILLMMMEDEIIKGPMINMDETTVQVLQGPRKSKSYMWVFKGGPPDKPIILFQYHPTRSGDVASAFLKNYKGIVQTDGYNGYNFLEGKKDILHVGCWVHARRKFKEVTKAAGNKKKYIRQCWYCTKLYQQALQN